MAGAGPDRCGRTLKSSYFAEVEIVHFHRWNNHVKGLLSAGADRSSHLFHLREHVNQAFIKSEVTHPVANLAIFHEKSTIPGHAGENFLVRVHFANVPKSRDQNSPL